MLVRPPFRNSTGYIAENAGLFDGSTGYLSWTPGSVGNRTTWTFSCWVKPAALGAAQIIFGAGADANNRFELYFTASDELGFFNNEAATATMNYLTDALFRDPTAWMHIVLKIDSLTPTLYVNGVSLSFSTSTNTATTTAVSNTVNHTVGRAPYAAASYLDGYACETALIDGQALDPSSFAEADPIYGGWLPKKLTGLTFGTNGFWIKDPSTGVDSSGNGNNWTVTGTITQVSDTPTDSAIKNVGNRATLNPVDDTGSNTYSVGNTTVALGVTSSVRATIPIPDTGQWCFEALVTSGSGASFGICDLSVNPPTGGTGAEISFHTDNSTTVYIEGVAKASAWSVAPGLVWTMVQVDMDALTISWKTGTDATTTYALTSGTKYGFWVRGDNDTVQCNFGEDTFNVTPTIGFKAIATQNLDESTAKLSKHMATVLYTGDGVAMGSGGNSQTGLLFSPDLLWMKGRSGATSHVLVNSLRGAGLYLIPDNTIGESATTSVSLDANGFTVGDNANAINNSGDTYVAWCFSLPSDETNTSGTISIDWKFNATLGMALGKYTGNGTAGATLGIPSAFGKAPFYVVIKQVNGANGWTHWHEGLTSGYYLPGFTTAAETNVGAATVFGNDTITVNPTSSVITLGTAGGVNGAGGTYIVLAFFETDLCKPVGYTGNNSADGPVDYLGGQPEYIFIKGLSQITT